MKILWKLALAALGLMPLSDVGGNVNRPSAVHGQNDANRLVNKVAVYIPGTVDGNVPNPHKQAEWTKKALRFFAARFGGATSVPGQGAWHSAMHGLVTESVMIVSSFGSAADLASHQDAIKEFALDMKAAMRQEKVAVEYAGRLELI